MSDDAGISVYRPDRDLPLVSLFRHNLWANLVLFDVCVGLDEGQLLATAVGTYGAIYDTLKHLAGAEQGYLNLITLRKQGTPLGWEERPSVATLRGYVQHSGEGLIAAAAQAAPADVVNIRYTNSQVYPVPASMLLTQAIAHAGEHRTQILTILTEIGIEPPDLSAWTFVEEHISPNDEL